MDNTLLPLLIILLLAICYVSTDYSNNNNKSKNDNGGMLICLLLVGIVIFVLMSNLNKTSENFMAPVKHDEKVIQELKSNKEMYQLVNPVYYSNAPVTCPHSLTEDIASVNFPTVDGTNNEGAPRYAFMFAKNQAHPRCCPSTYSTDRGCVCLTKEQKKFLTRRGGNKSDCSSY